jgi:hypothetical protein
MRLDKGVATKLLVSEVAGLDPITVFLDDMGQGRGRITISCYTKAWTAYWGAMGERTLAQFFMDASTEYLAENLQIGLSKKVFDPEYADTHAKRAVCVARRTGGLNANVARDLYDEVNDAYFADGVAPHSDLFERIYGEQWWNHMADKPNPDYTYLTHIVETVQTALKTFHINKRKDS